MMQIPRGERRSRIQIIQPLLVALIVVLLCSNAGGESPTVQVLRDVAYLGEHRSETMDLYLPGGTTEKPRPAILLIHGGGWHGGDKRAAREQNIGKNLAAAGYICASINYRLCKKTDSIADRLREVWPANLQDCRTAVRFLRMNAKTYSIDSEHIGAIGGSAGGHLAAMLAFANENDMKSEGPYAEFSSRIQAVVPMYGVHDVGAQARTKGDALSESDERLCRHASPITWISSDDPPALILHGTEDALVPLVQSEILHRRLAQAGVPSQLLIVDGAPHSFHLQPKQRDLRPAVIKFFDKHLKRTSPVTMNSDTTTYDFHPASTTTDAGATWYAWHAYRNSKDRICAQRTSADGQVGQPQILSQSGSAHGPPTIIGGPDDSVAVVWSRRNEDRCQIVMRQWKDEEWSESAVVSDASLDAIYPTAVAADQGATIIAWSAYAAGQWRVRCRRVDSSGMSKIIDCSSMGVNAFRPVLALHDDQAWIIWDQYEKHGYSVHGRSIHPKVSPISQISPDDEYCLTPKVLSHPSGLYVAWLRKADVMGGSGVVSQWHSLHAAVRDDTAWRQITTASGDTTAAELTHGLMAKIDPRPEATGGYLGPRLQPSLLGDGERVWLLWERKSNHRGSTATVSGDLIGRPSRDGKWQSPVVLKQGQVDYHPIDPPTVRDGKLRILSSPLPHRGIRHYETSEVSLADAQPFSQDRWTGWKPVSLPIKKERTSRRQITSNDHTWKLFWADLHCHNGLTADAEGEPDEMHFYARDRAGLDVVVFTNNDFYNVPLTQYDFELGHLFAKTFSAKPENDERSFLSLPGFEWTSRIPGVATAKLSDPGNWLPPYRNRSFPNHRSVIYPPSGGPLVHFTEVDNDITKLNEAVARAGGITLSQHNVFKLSDHQVEVGLELTSGWKNYIAQNPQLFHASLNQGVRLGFTANGDTHRRAPGLSGALTGIYAKELSAQSILDALRNRRCYATMGSQIFLDTRANGQVMGSETHVADGRVSLTLHAIGTRPIIHARLVRDGETIHEVMGNDTRELKASFQDHDLTDGTHWYYWRVTQSGPGTILPGNLMPAHGPLAWSSPNWVIVD